MAILIAFIILILSILANNYIEINLSVRSKCVNRKKTRTQSSPPPFSLLSPVLAAGQENGIPARLVNFRTAGNPMCSGIPSFPNK